MRKYIIAFACLWHVSFLQAKNGPWTCPDLSQGRPSRLAPFEVYKGHLTGRDKFKKIIVNSLGVSCLYRDTDPSRALILIHFGRFYALEPYAAQWHSLGAGTMAVYCTAGLSDCAYH